METLYKATIASKCNNLFNLTNYTIPVAVDCLYIFFGEVLQYEYKGKNITFDDLVKIYTKDSNMSNNLKLNNITANYSDGSFNYRLHFYFKKSNTSFHICRVDNNYEVYFVIEAPMTMANLKPICDYLENSGYFNRSSIVPMICEQSMSDYDKDESDEYKYIPSVVISKTYTGFVSLYKELRNLDKSYFDAFVEFIEEYDFNSIKDFVKCAKENVGKHFDIVDYSSVVEEKVYIDFKSKTDSGIHNYRVYIEENTDKNKLITVKIFSGILHKDFNNLKRYFENGWNIERSFVFMDDEED